VTSVARGLLAVFLVPAAASAQAPSPTSPTTATQGQPSQTPGPPAPTPQAPAPPGVPVQAPPPVARTFAAEAGLLFNTVRPERAKDFETFLSHLRFALDNATSPAVQAQAKGWRMFKAGEPGPNNTVLYVFVLDPAIKDADYGLGRILADAYPDTAQLTEIWKLYTSSVTGGGSLLNLNALKLEPPTPAPAPPATTTPTTPGAAR
jgi:hypothetical protein